MSDRLSITDSEILAELRAALETPTEDPEGAYTAAELAEATGLHIRRLRAKLVEILKRGDAEVVKVRRTGMDGRNSLVPAYRVRGKLAA